MADVCSGRSWVIINELLSMTKESLFRDVYGIETHFIIGFKKSLLTINKAVVVFFVVVFNLFYVHRNYFNRNVLFQWRYFQLLHMYNIAKKLTNGIIFEIYLTLFNCM